MNLEFISFYEKKFNKYLLNNIKEIKGRDNSNSRIGEGMEYALTAGGKRLRPIFFLLGGEEAGLSIEDIMNFAVGIEFIHTYSLVHDDLPGMDDDDLRRGKPTCHIKYGEGIAILIGDALLTHGIELMLKSIKGISLDVQLKAVNLLISSIGIAGMIGGQGADLSSEKSLVKNREEVLDYIHKNKTGKLLEASLLAGGILGEISEVKLNSLEIYARNFGLAFQITDDILDITSTKEELGKPIGSDEKKMKLTYPNVYGLEKSRDMAKDLVDSGIEAIKDLDKINDKLIDISRYLLIRKK